MKLAKILLLTAILSSLALQVQAQNTPPLGWGTGQPTPRSRQS
jgi:hypothetical protein